MIQRNKKQLVMIDRYTIYQKAGDCMTGKEVVNLIQKLEAEGMSAEKIIEIIKYVETAEPKKETE